MRIYPLELLLRDPSVGISLLGSLCLNLFIWGWLFVRFQTLEGDSVFLHYTVLFGVDRIGPYRAIFGIPAIGLFLLFVNTILGLVTYERDKFVARLFSVSTALLHLFLIVGAYLLIYLNV